jgi:hypothetical protein
MERSRYYERIDASGLGNHDDNDLMSGDDNIDTVGKSDTCWRCGQHGHISKNCTERGTGIGFLRCFLCGKLGHLSPRCPDARRAKSGFNNIAKRNQNITESNMEDAICIACNQLGHLNCKWVKPLSNLTSSSTTSFAPSQQLFCITCGESNHLQYDCKQKHQPGGEESSSSLGEFSDDDQGRRGGQTRHHHHHHRNNMHSSSSSRRTSYPTDTYHHNNNNYNNNRSQQQQHHRRRSRSPRGGNNNKRHDDPSSRRRHSSPTGGGGGGYSTSKSSSRHHGDGRHRR